ncbi:pitrilysin family protein [uncultured Erythrobacter sp.]|uniref:M16 family metallopeptidase n=1 Tax=uncultured Erythrobacter sp. TaxID=263913 RepID=UPI00260C9D6D|nr:pitrilysin family protein [uncultured Erythrobacter sp.]
MIRTVQLTSAVALAFAISTPAVAEEAEVQSQASSPLLSAPPIEYTMWTLDNGLRVIAVPDDTTSTVTTSLWYEIGSKHDPDGRSGFSHLFEHISSRKTENMPYNLIYSLTADIGGTRNASNWVDRTNYFEQVPAAYLETMLWTHRERMANLVVDKEVFESERGVVKEELRQRVLAPPYGRLQRFVLPENAYDVLPHRRAGIGSIEDLDASSFEDALAFYEAYYGPDTAALIVAGNFQTGDLRGLVDIYFADIPRRKNPIATTIAEYEPELAAPRIVEATGPNVPLPVIGGVWKAQPITHEDAPAIRVLATIISGGENNRLADALIRTGLAVQASGSAPMFREAGHINIYALARPDQLVAAGEALDAELARLATEPVTESELTEAKNEIVAASLRRRETARGRAFELGEALMASGDPDFADTGLAQITKVTAEDVRKVAARYLDPARRVTIRYRNGPEDASSYANPVPLPDFGTLDPATSPVRSVRPEAERELPPGPLESPTVAAPKLVETTLSNGIPVVAAQTGAVPLVTVSMVMPGGSKTDPEGHEGIAELAASLAASGFHENDAQSIAARFENLGATFEGNADSDGTTFSLTAPSTSLGAAGALAAQIIKGALYPDEEFLRERDRRIETLRVTMTDPSSVSRRAARTALYGDAPYGNLPDGTPESLANINRSDLLYHRQRFFHPDRMQIVISGGMATDKAIAVAEAMFGDWTTPSSVGRIVEEAAGEALSPRTIVVNMPGAGQASVFAALRAPARGSSDFDALQLANSVLGGGSSGRLFEEIRTKRSLSYGAYSRIQGRKDGSVLTASAQTRNENAAEVARIMLGEIAKLNEEELREDLLARRRMFLEGSYGRVLERSTGFNAIVSGLLLHELPATDAGRMSERLAGIDVSAANAAARSVIDPELATLVVVGEADFFLDDLRKLHDDIEVISLDELDLSSPSLRKEGG